LQDDFATLTLRWMSMQRGKEKYELSNKHSPYCTLCLAFKMVQFAIAIVPYELDKAKVAGNTAVLAELMQ